MKHLRSLYGLMSMITLAAIALAREFFYTVFSIAGLRPLNLSFDTGAVAGPSMTDVSPALFQRTRHEAGVSRVSAARNV